MNPPSYSDRHSATTSYAYAYTEASTYRDSSWVPADGYVPQDMSASWSYTTSAEGTMMYDQPTMQLDQELANN